MSDLFRTGEVGRLITGDMGYTRGIILENNNTGKKFKIQIQKYIEDDNKLNAGQWNNTDNIIYADIGFPVTEQVHRNLSVGKVVWCLYIYNTYFIVLATCN